MKFSVSLRTNHPPTACIALQESDAGQEFMNGFLETTQLPLSEQITYFVPSNAAIAEAEDYFGGELPFDSITDVRTPPQTLSPPPLCLNKRALIRYLLSNRSSTPVFPDQHNAPWHVLPTERPLAVMHSHVARRGTRVLLWPNPSLSHPARGVGHFCFSATLPTLSASQNPTLCLSSIDCYKQHCRLWSPRPPPPQTYRPPSWYDDSYQKAAAAVRCLRGSVRPEGLCHCMRALRAFGQPAEPLHRICHGHHAFSTSHTGVLLHCHCSSPRWLAWAHAMSIPIGALTDMWRHERPDTKGHTRPILGFQNDLTMPFPEFPAQWVIVDATCCERRCRGPPPTGVTRI